MKKAIVTGANGFVGKAVAQYLITQGVDVYAVVRKKATHLDGLEGCHMIECDLSDYKNLWKQLPQEADAFFHFAWSGSAGPARGDEHIQLANVQSSCDAVKSAALAGCKRFLFASSIMEYEVEKLMKTHIVPNITTIYSTAKITANYMARASAAQAGIEYISCVISNIYGPGEISPRLISSSLRKMMKGERTSFSSGEQLYDFIYITDAATMFYAIGKSGKPNQTYYIGNRHPRKLKDFLIEMHDIAAPHAEFGLGDLSFDGVSLTYHEFDTDSVYKDTNFVPQVSFAQGIQNTLAWIKETEAQI